MYPLLGRVGLLPWTPVLRSPTHAGAEVRCSARATKGQAMRHFQVMAWAALAAVATASLPGCDTQSVIGENPQLSEPVGGSPWQPDPAAEDPQPAGTSTNRIQFAVGGVPIGPGEIVEALPGDVLTVEVYVEPDPLPAFQSFTLCFVFAGPWPEPPLPRIGGPGEQPQALITSGHVRMYSPWDNSFAAACYSHLKNEYFFGGFLPVGLVEGPEAVAQFELSVPQAPASTLLSVEPTYGDLASCESSGLAWSDDNPTLIPLTLRVSAR